MTLTPETEIRKNRKILHVDADAFYCAVEQRDNPCLKGKAFAVGGKVESRGVIATCSYEARRAGIHSAMPSYAAMQKCPGLLIIPPRFSAYKKASEHMHAVFSRYTSEIEPLSLDEAYLDVSDCGKSATLTAQAIMRAVTEKAGITVSVGAAPNKFLAKIASDWNKPAGMYVITPGEVQAFLVNLPVGKIPGVGKVTQKKLQEKGIPTCGILQQHSQVELNQWFGSFGQKLWDMARGIDDRPVETNKRRKSLSVEHTYHENLLDESVIRKKILFLLDEFNDRFQKIQHEYRVHKRFVKVKFSDFVQTTLEEKVEGYPLSSETHFTDLTIQAFRRGNRPVRLLGIGVRLLDQDTDQDMVQLVLPY